MALRFAALQQTASRQKMQRVGLSEMSGSGSELVNGCRLENGDGHSLELL